MKVRVDGNDIILVSESTEERGLLKRSWMDGLWVCATEAMERKDGDYDLAITIIPMPVERKRKQIHNMVDKLMDMVELEEGADVV